ncbi:hypothetical protein NEOLEDRAFT_1024010, partial [Neolentinus lepideus HHB14362 ss-1]
INIGGVDALALVDSGSTLDCIQLDFAWIANIVCYELKNPMNLQLGTVGSRSKVNYCMDITFTVTGQVLKHYFDVANIDRYNIVIGTPLLRALCVKLDFENK